MIRMFTDPSEVEKVKKMSYTNFKQCILDPTIRRPVTKKIMLRSTSRVLTEEDMSFYLS